MKLTMQQPLLHPILKYPGGKLREWPIIKSKLPKIIVDYYEPFVGGGSTWLNINANHYYINDLSTDLMNLYTYIKNKDKKFIKIIRLIDDAWEMSYMAQIINVNPRILLSNHKKICLFINKVEPNLFQSIKFLISNENTVKQQLVKCVNLKIKSLQHIQQNKGFIKHLVTNTITAIKDTIYTLLRSKYNITKDITIKTAIYWYLREYCYSSMFRFNLKGNFNVPFGGSSYDGKRLLPKLNLSLSKRFQNKLQATTLMNSDFNDALHNYVPNNNDFVFLDPPYDTAFSTYDNNTFDQNKQIELAEYLKTELKSNFMLIIKSSSMVHHLYHNNDQVIGGNRSLKIRYYDKHYQVSFQNRNSKKASHLLITNY